MAPNPQLAALREIGQSIWYDNLSRDVLRSGELKKIIDAGVLGLTSNPTIFKKAIADSNDYDTDIAAASKRGLDADAICEELMIGDVAQAADLLRPIYDSTKGMDGCASIEVSPTLARDTKGTIAAAQRIWKKLNRPNIMVKIPGTKEGIPAIRACLEEGININVTLLFSDTAYCTVAEAYLAALEARVAKGQPIDRIASVASFFVSRVDALCEKKFDELVKAGKAQASDKPSFEAKIGIKNSELAYTSFKRLFSGPRWDKLAAKGAMVQRPLWASTGTKNPSYSPVLYVEALAGPHTVDTVPPATLKALMDKATIKSHLNTPRAECEAFLAHVNKLGIPFAQCMVELEQDGVKLFAEAYRDLISAIETKRAKVG